MSKCAHCGRGDKLMRFFYYNDELDDGYCSLACALEENNLVPLSRARCAVCGSMGVTFVDELSGALYCSPKCALSANQVHKAEDKK